ncbi:MAG: hypothetical protein ACK41D_04590 [Rubricoccaceae bacterium]
MRILYLILIVLVGLHLYRAFSAPVSRVVLAVTERVEVCRGGQTETLARYIAERETRRGRVAEGPCPLSAHEARRARRDARKGYREARREYRHASDEAREELRRIRDAARADHEEARRVYRDAKRIARDARF